MKILMFEDEHVDRLYPLTYLRPVFELRCGALSLRRKVEAKFPDCQLQFETRPTLQRVAAESYGAEAVNNPRRLQPDEDLLLIGAGTILTSPAAAYTGAEAVATTRDGDFLWAHLKADTVRQIQPRSAGELAGEAIRRLPSTNTDDLLVAYPWDPVKWNASQIVADFKAVYGQRMEMELSEGVAVLGPDSNLHVAEGVELQPLSLIDCRQGPVIIEPGCVVSAHTSIQGPAYIGAGTKLCEARIREGSSIGPVCRVGGEVEESIIHSHSIKYHTGFLGHSYVAEWVNLGALTTNSDLKNDYGAVSVYVGGRPVNTGSMKVGAFIGDHTKTSIGTLLNTGSMIGIMCNLVAGQSVLPKSIPSFCWYLNNRISKGLGLDYALKTARAAMARRDVKLTDAMIELIKNTEELTRGRKMEAVRRDRKKALR